MKQPTVLIADDEIPYEDERDRQTREAFLKTRPKATEEEYRKGYRGMKGAVDALNKAEFVLKIANRFKEAEDLIAKESFDVAVIDLGWAAEPDLKDYDTAGMRLVRAMQRSARGRLTRVIMYSSRYDDEPELAESAVRLGTLPLLKTYRPGSHQTLLAAVRFLANGQLPPAEVALSQAVEHCENRSKELHNLQKQFQITTAAVAVLIMAGVTMLVIHKTTLAAIQASGAILVTLLLGFISRQIRAEVNAVERALDRIINHVRGMPPTRGAG